MVNTELTLTFSDKYLDYNILNIVVNTEPLGQSNMGSADYNILNIVVNTEHRDYY